MKILTVDSLYSESEKSVGVLDTKGTVQYLPKSQIEIIRGKREIAIHVPEWLASQKENLEFEDE